MEASEQASGERPARVRWSGLTHPGRTRQHNEDAFLALMLDANDVRLLGKTGEAGAAEQDFVFAVSDGMGGANAGEFASEVAVDSITRLLPRTFRTAAMGMEVGFQDILVEVFERIHNALGEMGRSYEELEGMGATLSLCWLRPGWVYFGHVGDSRVYHLPASGGIRQVSPDDTHVGWLQRQGKINERQARAHPRRHGLQQVLGGKTQRLHTHIGAVGYERGDCFLVCSDGVIEGLWDRGLYGHIREPHRSDERPPAQRLVEEAVKTDGKDNTTAVVFELL